MKRLARLGRLGRLGRFLVIFGGAAFVLVFWAGVSLAVAVYGVAYPVAELAPERGGPLVITDRNGLVLRTVAAEGGRPGREAWVTLDRIPSTAVLVVLASEDLRFYEHGGVDPWGVARAVWLNLSEGRLGYGGSTLTQQLVRMVRYPDDERTFGRKLVTSVLALRLERSLSKQEILEQYLNRAYYGHGAYGIEAAAQTYFGKPAASLSPGEATLLAVIPRGPVRYDPLKRLGETLRRREHVFGLLAGRGLMTAEQIAAARAEELRPSLHAAPFRAPHFVDWVLGELPSDVRARGGVVKTTIDLTLQTELEHRVAEHVGTLAGRGLSQAGVVVLDTQSGSVLAMVGSASFAAEDGQLNIVTRRRHPGSALKPFVYALALEGGASPASIALDMSDVPSAYRVKYGTQPERGPVRFREALAGSYNLAAVHVLEDVGTSNLLDRLRLAGLEVPGTPDDYGLRMALGAPTVRLVDLAAAYGFLGRAGKVTRARGIAQVTYANGVEATPPAAPEVELFSPEVSWLVMDMLSDADARRPGFGPELPIDIPAVAVKTGTSRGFADTVAVGVTRELTVAAWGGTFDGTPTQGLIAMKAAAPLVRAGFQLAARGRRLSTMARPAGLVAEEVCPLSGLRPGEGCPHRKREWFLPEHRPTHECVWHSL